MDKNIINEISSDAINLSSFEIQNKLNPYVWDNFSMRENVRKKLLTIAADFIKFLDIPWVKIKDVTLTGSLANFNWSKYSDFDLHIIVDYNDVDENHDLVSNYFNAQKNLWNETHNIMIHCYEVEVYVQDSNEPHSSTGVYSILKNEWITVPVFNEPKLDKKLIKTKSASIITQIEDIIDLFNNGEYEKVIERYEKLNTKIKNMRKAGLDKGGEFSYENIVFKVLRRSGYLDKLREIKDKSYDLINSIGSDCKK